MFVRFVFGCMLLMAPGSAVWANVHLWHIEELYSNAEGTLQFIEIDTTSINQQVFKTGGNDTRFISKTTGGAVHATWFFPSNLSSYTLINGHRKVLVGTSTLAAAASVTPDFSAAVMGFLPEDFLLPEGGRIDMFSPNWGTIHFANYPALEGGDQSYQVHDLAHDLNSPTNFANQTGFIPGIQPELAGDYNDDGVVNMADYSVWRDTLGTADDSADGNGDGMVDGDDYDLWQAAFGSSLGAAAAVPEPRALSLAIAGILVFAMRCCCRQPGSF